MESTLTSDLLRLVGVAILVLANGFFVAAEFSLVSVRRTRIEELVRQGKPGSASVKRALEDPDRFIAATQLGITIASLGLGWLGEPALSHFIQPVLPESESWAVMAKRDGNTGWRWHCVDMSSRLRIIRRLVSMTSMTLPAISTSPER